MAYLGGTTGICRVFPFMASTNYDFVEQVDVFSMQYNTIPWHTCVSLCLMVQSLGDRLSSNIRQIKHGRHFIVLLWEIHIAWTIL